MDRFPEWLSQNGLSEVLTTGAGDTLYTNIPKLFGVLKKAGEHGVYSFYLDDIVGSRTYDDGFLVAEWYGDGVWHYFEKQTKHSTSEMYIQLLLKNNQILKLQLFKAAYRNLPRDSYDHLKLFDYACQMSGYIYDFVNNLKK